MGSCITKRNEDKKITADPKNKLSIKQNIDRDA